jgi:hypothetical protein
MLHRRNNTDALITLDCDDSCGTSEERISIEALPVAATGSLTGW